MVSLDDLRLILIRKEVSGISVIGAIATARRSDRGSSRGRGGSDEQRSGLLAGNERKTGGKGNQRRRVEVELGARESNPGRVNQCRREYVRFL